LEYTDYEKLVFRVFSTDNGRLLMKELEDKFIKTPIVQEDGMLPSSIRQGKADLVRALINIHNRIEKDI